MIQVSNSNELKSKATKGSLADFAEKEANRLEHQQLWCVVGCILLVVGTYFMGKLGWFVLPAVVFGASLYVCLERKVADLRSRSATYKKFKTIRSKRPSL